MSDNDCDIFSYNSGSTFIQAKGPNMNVNTSTQNGVPFSVVKHPNNSEQQCFMNQWFPHSNSSQKLRRNGQSGSAMSVRSMDSNATMMSAVDVALVFQTQEFDRNEIELMENAFRRMKEKLKIKSNNRSNKRRNRKGMRRPSFDLGNQASESSMSSDDSRLTTSKSISYSFKKRMFDRRFANNNRSKLNLINLRNTLHDSQSDNDNTDRLRQNNLNRMFCQSSQNIGNHLLYNPGTSNTVTNSYEYVQQGVLNDSHHTTMHPFGSKITQNERLKQGYLLPCQRFNKSFASFITTDTNKIRNNFEMSRNKTIQPNINFRQHNSDSDYELSIFSEEKARDIRKRPIKVVDDVISVAEKKTKLCTPRKTENKPNHKQIINKMNFVFAKPQLPVKKTLLKPKETLISKSAQPLEDAPQPIQNILKTTDTVQEQHNSSNHIEEQIENASDVSMKPSFMKRKLFTQTIDMTESKNLSSDSVNSSSIQDTVYSAISREKNKTRKLVTSQSCLSREIQPDDNLLNLIHKIIPPNQLNLTANKTESNGPKESLNNKQIECDNWDITSILSTCDNDDISDTYTDEDIFNNQNGSKKYCKDRMKNRSREIKCKNVIDVQEDCTKTCESDNNTNKGTNSTTFKISHCDGNKLTKDIISRKCQPDTDKVTKRNSDHTIHPTTIKESHNFIDCFLNNSDSESEFDMSSIKDKGKYPTPKMPLKKQQETIKTTKPPPENSRASNKKDITRANNKKDKENESVIINNKKKSPHKNADRNKLDNSNVKSNIRSDAKSVLGLNFNHNNSLENIDFSLKSRPSKARTRNKTIINNQSQITKETSANEDKRNKQSESSNATTKTKQLPNLENNSDTNLNSSINKRKTVKQVKNGVGKSTKDEEQNVTRDYSTSANEKNGNKQCEKLNGTTNTKQLPNSEHISDTNLNNPINKRKTVKQAKNDVGKSTKDEEQNVIRVHSTSVNEKKSNKQSETLNGTTKTKKLPNSENICDTNLNNPINKIKTVKQVKNGVGKSTKDEKLTYAKVQLNDISCEKNYRVATAKVSINKEILDTLNNIKKNRNKNLNKTCKIKGKQINPFKNKSHNNRNITLKFDNSIYNSGNESTENNNLITDELLNTTCNYSLRSNRSHHTLQSNECKVCAVKRNQYCNCHNETNVNESLNDTLYSLRSREINTSNSFEYYTQNKLCHKQNLKAVAKISTRSTSKVRKL